MIARVHPRVLQRHPDLSCGDVVTAWRGCHAAAVRVPGEREVRLGFDNKGRELEMVGVMLETGWLVYHAMTPPTKRFKREMEKARRRLG